MEKELRVKELVDLIDLIRKTSEDKTLKDLSMFNVCDVFEELIKEETEELFGHTIRPAYIGYSKDNGLILQEYSLDLDDIILMIDITFEDDAIRTFQGVNINMIRGLR